MSTWLKAWQLVELCVLAWQLVEWDAHMRHFKWVGCYYNFWGCYCNCRAS
jgi:hypothetical protein